MEHIVQFAIGIDDEAITRRITDNAEKIIIKNLQDQVENQVFYKDFSGPRRGRLQNWAQNMIIDDFLEKNKDEILSMAATRIAERLARSKAGKAILEDLTNQGDQNG